MSRRKIPVVMILPGRARLFSLFLMCHYVGNLCIGGDASTSSVYIRDPGSITSSGGIYKLGFFSPNGSVNRFVGIWQNKIPAYYVLWVANRETPILDSSGVVMISDDGNLVIINGKKEVVWSSNVTMSATNRTAQLLDSGNLILLKQGSSSAVNDTDIFWQSFEHMSDLLLSKMKLSSNIRTNEKFTSSWKSPSNPLVGSFMVTLESLIIPEVVLSNGSIGYWRSGPRNGNYFIEVPHMRSVYLNWFKLVDDKDGTIYLTYNFGELSYLSYFIVKPNGNLEQPAWYEKENHWANYRSSWESDCDVYGKCGTFRICNANASPICNCSRGFEPKNIEEWSRGNWSEGCVWRSLLQCERIKNGSTKAGKKDGFLKIENAKVPNYAIWYYHWEDHCQKLCLSNCSCLAYAYDAGIGCTYWSGDLIDTQKFSFSGADLYIQLAHTEHAAYMKPPEPSVFAYCQKRDQIEIIATAVIVGAIIFIILKCFCRRRLKKRQVRKSEEMWFSDGEASLVVSDGNMLGENLGKVYVQELVLYKLEELAAATSNFNDSNKLAQGETVKWERNSSQKIIRSLRTRVPGVYE